MPAASKVASCQAVSSIRKLRNGSSIITKLPRLSAGLAQLLCVLPILQSCQNVAICHSSILHIASLQESKYCYRFHIWQKRAGRYASMMLADSSQHIILDRWQNIVRWQLTELFQAVSSASVLQQLQLWAGGSFVVTVSGQEGELTSLAGDTLVTKMLTLTHRTVLSCKSSPGIVGNPPNK
jgi:hypothetical protein